MEVEAGGGIGSVGLHEFLGAFVCMWVVLCVGICIGVVWSIFI